MTVFTVDGTAWTVPCKIERTAEVTASEISGILLDRSYFNDVIGTYMKYSVALAVPQGQEAQYYALYEILNDPVDGHTFVLPYGAGTVTITGRVTDIRDTWYRSTDGNYWAGCEFTIISNAPTKEYSLGEAISRGFTPLPEESAVSVGQCYTYTASGWEAIGSADSVSY